MYARVIQVTLDLDLEVEAWKLSFPKQREYPGINHQCVKEPSFELTAKEWTRLRARRGQVWTLRSAANYASLYGLVCISCTELGNYVNC